MDYLVDVDFNFHVGLFGIPCQYHAIKPSGTTKTFIDLVEEAIVSIQKLISKRLNVLARLSRLQHLFP
jgi:hypothetical protein